MRRFLFAPLLAAALVFGALVAPVGAITGGQPDGDNHPQVALLLAPGLTFCSGALISDRTILTAGHCTSFWTELAADPEYDELWDDQILVSFDAQAEVDEDWQPVNPDEWHTASSWLTHPEYVDAEWPFTYDYGLLYLDAAVTGIEPATLAAPNALQPIIDSNGKSHQQFDDVGYGVQGKTTGGGPPAALVTWQRKIATNRVSPGNGSGNALLHETWFILQNVPSWRQGGACGGDSGSPVFFHGTTDIVAVHTGGYRMGRDGVLCGRKTSLNHRVDLPEVHAWITANTISSP
jgi:hypothetical protein